MKGPWTPVETLVTRGSTARALMADQPPDLRARDSAVSEHGVAQELRRHSRHILELNADALVRYVHSLLSTWQAAGSVTLFGNGGSAATASHHAADLANGATGHTMRPMACVSLTDNVPLLTAIANDHGFESAFATLVRIHRPDLAVAFSVSGQSPNVIAGLAAARQLGASCVAFTGSETALLTNVADIVICCRSVEPGAVEAAHDAAAHVAARLLRASIDGKAPRDNAQS
jgi:D-sedoheptulose 7-phosphate isomerase